MISFFYFGFIYGIPLVIFVVNGHVIMVSKHKTLKQMPELKFPKWDGDPQRISLELIIPGRLRRERRHLAKAGYWRLGDMLKYKKVDRVGKQTLAVVDAALDHYGLKQYSFSF